MATSSSNKMPLLVDRPMHSFATIGGAAALTTATNFNTPAAAGCVVLVDCSSNDGAVIDSLSIVALEANTTARNVVVFLSTATTATSVTAANSAYVGGAAIASSAVGTRTNVPLPPLSVPVPNLASPAATMAAYPSETDKKNTGLYVPSGALIYVGVDQAIAAPSANTRVHVFAQGGFF
jgi:hypothetical protein|tara:strand:- start:1286 stop:1822 length:537 start_codon:yes stop_codon:yes gene_type:complete